MLWIAATALGWALCRRGDRRPWIVALPLLCVGADAPESHGSVEVSATGGRYIGCSGVESFGAGGATLRQEWDLSAETAVGVHAKGSAGHVGDPLGAFELGAGLDARWVGAELGGALIGETQGLRAYPVGRVRLGPRDLLFVDGRFLDFPWGPTRPGIELGGGIGLPRLGDAWRRSWLRAGVGLQGFYVNPHLVLPGRLEVDTYVAFGDPETFQGGLTITVHLSDRQHRDR